MRTLICYGGSGRLCSRVAEEDKEKTAFATPDGLYQFKWLGFGLTNSPACFMSAMHRVSKGLFWSDCLVYLDNVIIFGRTLEEHRDRLAVVLTRLAEAGLKINPKKCKLLADKVTVLGHVSREGISTEPEKVRVVQEWPAPSNISQLRSFLGTASYYCHFVPKYADLAAPLYRMEQKSKNWEWTQGCHEAFLNIKHQIVDAPILAFPRLVTLFILDTDASDSGIGAVLSQLQDSRERVIAYAAQGLSKSERNYSTTRRELLALVWGAEHFQAYPCGKTFVARTDHKALRWLKNFKNPKGQTARLLERLSDFDIKVEHWAGSSHGNADGLSRNTLG